MARSTPQGSFVPNVSTCPLSTVVCEATLLALQAAQSSANA
jgi:hypothetical protein